MNIDLTITGTTPAEVQQEIADWFAEAVNAREGATRTVRVLIPAEPAAWPPIEFDDVKAETCDGHECYIESSPVTLDGSVAVYDLRVSEGRVSRSDRISAGAAHWLRMFPTTRAI